MTRTPPTYLLLLTAFFALGSTHLACSAQPTSTTQAIASVDSLLQATVAEALVPGAVVRIEQRDQTLLEAAYGHAQRYGYRKQPLDTPLPMTPEHRFDLASLTKVLATTFGVMVLVDQGRVSLDAPLFSYLPSFRGVSKDSVTIRHLLTHSAGLYPWKPLYYHARTPQETYAYINQLPLAYPVGKERQYSDLGFMLLGYAIEAVSGQALDVFLEDTVYGPLGLQHTAFRPSATGPPFAATSHGNPFEKRMVADDDFGYLCEENPDDFQDWRDYVLVGEVNDGNAHHAHQGLAGHAGLFSTAAEIQALVSVLLDKGNSAGRRILSEAVIDTFLTKTTSGHGLGWAMSTDVIPATALPEGSFGHTGFTGTYVVAMPRYDLSIIVLTNRQNNDVNPSGYYNSLTSLRKAITDTMLEAIRHEEPYDP